MWRTKLSKCTLKCGEQSYHNVPLNVENKVISQTVHDLQLLN